MGARVSDSSPCELRAAWLGLAPGLGLALTQGRSQRSDIREQTHRHPTVLLPPHLAQVHMLGRAHILRPQPLLPSKTLVGCSQEPQVWSGQEQLYTRTCTGGYMAGGSPGMSTILCASWEARSLCDRAHTLFEKFICISDTNGVSSDPLPLCSAQPENLLSGALTVQGKVPCSWLSSHRTAGRIR